MLMIVTIYPIKVRRPNVVVFFFCLTKNLNVDRNAILSQGLLHLEKEKDGGRFGQARLNNLLKDPFSLFKT